MWQSVWREEQHELKRTKPNDQLGVKRTKETKLERKERERKKKEGRKREGGRRGGLVWWGEPALRMCEGRANSQYA